LKAGEDTIKGSGDSSIMPSEGLILQGVVVQGGRGKGYSGRKKKKEKNVIYVWAGERQYSRLIWRIVGRGVTVAIKRR